MLLILKALGILPCMYNVFSFRVNVQLYKEEIGELRDKLNKEKKTR